MSWEACAGAWSEFDLLERVPGPSPERADLALQLLDKHLPVPADLKAKVRLAYSEGAAFLAALTPIPRHG